jgi:hypothetical protein
MQYFHDGIAHRIFHGQLWFSKTIGQDHNKKIKAW